MTRPAEGGEAQDVARPMPQGSGPGFPGEPSSGSTRNMKMRSPSGKTQANESHLVGGSETLCEGLLNGRVREGNALSVNGAEEPLANRGYGIERTGADPEHGRADYREYLVEKAVATLSVFSVMRAVVQFDGEYEASRFPIAKHEVDVLLRNGSPEAGSPIRPGTSHYVRQANFAHDEKRTVYGLLEGGKESRLSAREKRVTTLVGKRGMRAVTLGTCNI